MAQDVAVYPRYCHVMDLPREHGIACDLPYAGKRTYRRFVAIDSNDSVQE